MKPLRTHTGTAVPLRKSNVDTDQIYPAQALLTGSMTKTGHAAALMGEWRKDPGFVLNKPEYAGGSVLVAGPDFGTGSSREWAVWALADYGFRVIFSVRFGDIFRANAANNGLVAATLPGRAIEALWEQIEAEPQTPLTVDLEHRVVSVADHEFTFEYPDDFRWRVLNGIDEIELTMRYDDDITRYETRRRASMPKVTRPEVVA